MRVLARPAFKNAERNPYNHLLYTALQGLGVSVSEFTPGTIFRGRHDIWHVHWPEDPLKLPRAVHAASKGASLLALMSAFRARGGRIVWTIHNLQPHECAHPKLLRWYYHRLLSRIDGWTSLTEAGRDIVAREFPALMDRPAQVIPHGHYREQYAPPVPRAEARQRLGLALDEPVLLHFGHIRPYKNVPHLVRTFRALPRSGATLVVAGQPRHSTLEREIRAAAGDDGRVRLRLEFTPAAQVPLLFSAADLAVLPFSEILNSGSAMLALSFNRPVLVPAHGSMPELARQLGKSWVRTYDGDLAPGPLQDAIDWAIDAPRPDAAPLDAFEWSRIAQATHDFFSHVMEAPRAAQDDA